MMASFAPLVRDGVHGHRHRSAEEASEEGGHPLAGILAPEQDAIAFRDTAAIEFARKPHRRSKQVRVGPPHHAIAATPSDCDFT